MDDASSIQPLRLRDEYQKMQRRDISHSHTSRHGGRTARANSDVYV